MTYRVIPWLLSWFNHVRTYKSRCDLRGGIPHFGIFSAISLSTINSQVNLNFVFIHFVLCMEDGSRSVQNTGIQLHLARPVADPNVVG